MATITVVRPKPVFLGPTSHFAVFDEAASLNTAALGILVLDSSGNAAISADDPAVGTIIGQNMAATANSGSAGTDVTMLVWVPGTIVEINTNSTGTDPVLGVEMDFEFTVGTAPNQTWQANMSTISTASSGTNLGTATYIMRGLSPRDASLDTNVRVYAGLRAPFLAFWYGQ